MFFLMPLPFNLIVLSPQELAEDKVVGGIRPHLLIYDIIQFEGSSDVYHSVITREGWSAYIESSLNHGREQ